MKILKINVTNTQNRNNLCERNIQALWWRPEILCVKTIVHIFFEKELELVATKLRSFSS